MAVTLLGGAATADITPAPGGSLAGYAARVVPSTGVHDPLSAIAVAVSDGTTTSVVVAADLIALDPGTAAAVAVEAAARAAVPATNIAVAVTHTHGGPAVTRAGIGGTTDPSYLATAGYDPGPDPRRSFPVAAGIGTRVGTAVVAAARNATRCDTAGNRPTPEPGNGPEEDGPGDGSVGGVVRVVAERVVLPLGEPTPEAELRELAAGWAREAAGEGEVAGVGGAARGVAGCWLRWAEGCLAGTAVREVAVPVVAHRAYGLPAAFTAEAGVRVRAAAERVARAVVDPW